MPSTPADAYKRADCNKSSDCPMASESMETLSSEKRPISICCLTIAHRHPVITDSCMGCSHIAYGNRFQSSNASIVLYIGSGKTAYSICHILYSQLLISCRDIVCMGTAEVTLLGDLRAVTVTFSI